MFSYFQSKKEENKSISDHICTKLLVGIVETVNEEFPGLNLQKEKLIEEASNEIKKLVHSNIEKIDTKELFH